jgi:hypothetical protein
VLALLRGGGDADRLGAALSADEVMELRGAILEPDRMVAMSKTRQLFQQRNCRIDLVRFHAHGHHAGSLGIESPSESDLRALVHGMDLHTLGASRIYMDFLYGTPQV